MFGAHHPAAAAMRREQRPEPAVGSLDAGWQWVAWPVIALLARGGSAIAEPAAARRGAAGVVELRRRVAAASLCRGDPRKRLSWSCAPATRPARPVRSRRL